MPSRPEPAHELWLTLWGSNQIGRIKSNQAFEIYNLTTPHAEPHGIASGDGKTVWFALECGKIGKLTQNE